MNIGGKRIDNFRYADDTILLTESSNDLKPLLMKVKEESVKAELQLDIRTKITTMKNRTS